MSTTGSRAGTRITLAAATYTDITTQFEALGDSVYVQSLLTDWEVGLVTDGETPSALPDINEAGSVLVTKTHESTLDVYAYSVGGGDIWLVAADKIVVNSVGGTTSA